jgi:formylglycine-generating enzyme required for sulfatase activity
VFRRSSAFRLAPIALGLILGVSLAAPFARAQEAGKKLALLVGIEKYPSGSGFSSLPFPQRDVDALARVLIDSGYRPEHVRVMTVEHGAKNDPRFLPIGQNILQEFRLLAGDRKAQDSVLIALVGHGLTRKVRVKDGNGNEVEKSAGFFCPMNADIRDTKSMISLDELYGELEQCKAGVKVMLVDACRDNPTEGNTAVIPFAPPAVPASVAALFSCSDGEVAWEEADLGGGHGVFFHFVIEGLKGAADGNKDGAVSLLELTEYTQDKVPDFVSNRRGRRQMPVLLGRAGRVTLVDRSRGKAARGGMDANTIALNRATAAAVVDRATRVGGAEVVTTRIARIKLKLISAGDFLMGSPDSDKEASDKEKPQHRVVISRPFYLGVTEVTQAAYEEVMGVNPSWFSSSGRGKQDVEGLSTDRHPVEEISWLAAVTFCNKLSTIEGMRPFYEIAGKDVRVLDWNGTGYRLPTEAEWEYACRSRTTTRYCFGDDEASLVEFGWFRDNSEGRTHPVGEKRPNGFGLFDMHGNVHEWCWDWGGSHYARSAASDPHGQGAAADAKSGRVCRGGCCYDNSENARSASRKYAVGGLRPQIHGFRLARGQSSH